MDAPIDLTDIIMAARRGLRRDVALLVARLDAAELLLPLVKSVEGIIYGAEQEITRDFSIQPHMLVDGEGNAFAAAFTHPDIIQLAAGKLGWTTDGGPLEFASVPARVALDLSLQVIDDDAVLGLVLNPMHESELILRRSEIGSILQGRALPLVGYVEHIPLQDFEETLVAEGAEPPPAALVEAIERCVLEDDDLVGYELSSTFNADRDLEPHLTLRVRPAKTDVDFEAVTRRLVEQIGDLVPPPGYIDIVFDDPRGSPKGDRSP